MSGFQAIGIVLGVFPLAISALENHQKVAARLRLFSKMKLEYRKCSNELEFQQVTFVRHLKQLLLPLVIDNEKVQELIDKPAGEAWRDVSMVELLEKRLGDSYELYQEYISGMNHVMDKLYHELALNDESVQSKLLDTSKRPATVSRIRSALGRDDLSFQLFRIKFSNGESVRSKLFAELQAYNDKLDKLLDSSDRVSALEERKASRHQERAIDSAICSFWVQATKLFKALTATWKCHCTEHHTILPLQHRATKSVEFELLFLRSLPSYWEVRTAKISKVENAVGESGFATSTIKVVETLPLRQPNHRPYQLISNLCNDLNQSDGSCCGYLPTDEQDCRYFVYTVSSQRRSSITSISLDHILGGDVSPPPTRRQRYAISLALASSFLQLLETPWLTSSFRREDIMFFSDPTNTRIFLLDQPHIARGLAASSSTDRLTTSLAQALDQLGILLLELCFGKLLTDQPLRKAWHTGETEEERARFDAMAARDWQCEVIEEAGPDYSEAVAWCLGGNRSAPPERWRQNMLRNVVMPLQRCQEYFVNSRMV
ncbi:hypothetical protein CFAM422_001132 [Trichoderma lentiforme]|uniref:DUF7580 domain-containing protein n=1 Tax=Trichoderma lentiforme TaxID=1567552 RepID=A0A9P4XL64_9HYPO|nr:hypothetical protein CFAM422_001132 [Trichoderma lentiforme]